MLKTASSQRGSMSSNSTLGHRSVQPLISIVLTTFNSEKYLEATLRGILQQNFPLNLVELIIVDGGSTDRTIEILQTFIRNNRSRFWDITLIVHDRNYGVSRARNDGIKMSEGKYVLILDSDVVLPPNALSELVNFLEANQDPKTAGVKALHMTPEAIAGRLTLDLLFNCKYVNRIAEFYSVADATLLRKEVLEEVGLYREDMGPPFSSYEDWELGLRIKKKGYRLYVLGNVIAVHKPRIKPQEEAEISNIKGNLLSQITTRVRGYFSLKNARILNEVLKVGSLKDRAGFLILIIMLNLSVFAFIYGLLNSSINYMVLSLLLLMLPYFAYAIYAIIFFKCKLIHRILSAIAIITSRITRSIALECFYIFIIVEFLKKDAMRLVEKMKG